jgi:hypothetical protein
MKAASFAALVVLATLASSAKAEDTVRVCIAASTDGQTLRKQGRLLAAREEMIACARDACPAIVRSHCARWLSEVEAATPSVVVRAEDAAGADAMGARLSIDGHPAKLDGQPARLDPGPHALVIENDRAERKEERLLLVEGETARRVTLRFPSATTTSSTSASPAPGKHARTVPLGAWILAGAGIAALGGATYFGLTAKSDLDGLDATCSPHCSDAQTQPGRTNALLFDVFVGTGAAAVTGALVWAIALPSHGVTVASTPRLELLPLVGGAFTSLSVSY